MRVLITRPEAQAREWAQRLADMGVDTRVLPLIGIAAPEDAAPVRAAWASLGSQRLVMFVSPNAVQQFFALRPAGVGWPAETSAASPGPGTTQALLGEGLAEGQIVAPAASAASFDSESLWQQLAGRDWRGASVLFVRGESGRDWLAERLREAGAQVAHVTAYRRLAPSLTPEQAAWLHEALAEPAQHLWWFSSSEAIDHLEALVQPPAAWDRGRAIATHPRIAQRARQLGFGRVDEVSTAPEAVLALIGRSIQSRAP